MILKQNDASDSGAGKALLAPPAPLQDSWGRVHRSLRISVTDVCNIRCQYCMPETGVQFTAPDRLLSYDQIVRFVEVAAAAGIQKVRITGGEPLTRPGLEQLIARLAEIEGIQDIAMTTNGMLLPKQLPALVAAGLQRLNISLDTLSAETFKLISRRDGLQQVLEGIDAACQVPSLGLKINSLVLRDLNLQDVLELVRFARERSIVIRFIEFMPLDGGRTWSDARMVSGAELRELISTHVGALRPVGPRDLTQPAQEFEFENGPGRVGFIDSVSAPFCSGCDRLRLTAEGKLRNCLFGKEEWDVAPWLSTETFDAQQIRKLMQDCVRAKYQAHGIGTPGFTPPERAMYQIGG
ncbi:GTP 3',8-cyclase MoaA [Aureliella helgolandensis]|uniref:GTP 3',8-cyclase n=1 Tax=Aureliella helgolandensis TaxID=2527968 RepID=A0A518GDD4_9BACT|nr:GTP 3',8-cyclase MoaA [Aureliella helgolandensis]QDV26606.1 Cyclic pyranopterin monophosphate synthase [Aureliella helgolandensis]